MWQQDRGAIPDSLTNSLLLLNADIKNEVAVGRIPLYRAPIASSHDELLLSIGAICILGEDWLLYVVRNVMIPECPEHQDDKRTIDSSVSA